jgi:hypothetical protein
MRHDVASAKYSVFQPNVPKRLIWGDRSTTFKSQAPHMRRPVRNVLTKPWLVALINLCGVGVVIAIMSAQRNRIQGVSQPAIVLTCKTGSCRTQQVTEAAVEEQCQEHSGTRHAAKNTARKNTMHQLQHTSALKELTYILSCVWWYTWWKWWL